MGNEFSQITRGQIVEGFVHPGKAFVFYSKDNGNDANYVRIVS